MKYEVNFQYRPKREGARPEDEPMLTVSGELYSLSFQDSGLLPVIGDHVVFLRAGGERNEAGEYVSKTEQIEGVVENRLFFFLTNKSVGVNIVVTDSTVNSGMLIKE